MFLGSILAENAEIIRYIIVIILGISIITTVIKKLFKLAIFLGIIALVAHFLYPLIQR